jgi:hypothetical protein
MSRAALALVCAALIGSMPPGCAAERLGRITSFIGAVHITRARSGASMSARVNSPVFIADTVSTGVEGRCEIACEDGIVIRTGESSVFVVAKPHIDSRGAKGNGLKVAAGSIWVNAKKLAGAKQFDLATPTVTAGIRGTAYNIDCSPNASEVMVFDGVVAVRPVDSSARDSAYALGAGERIAVVRNIDEFIEAQRHAYETFQQKEQDAYDRFLREEQEAFDTFTAEMERELESMRQRFEPVGDLHVARQTFALDSASSREWIRWNLERDAAEAPHQDKE